MRRKPRRSWFEEQWAASRRFRWGVRWLELRWRLFERPWLWITDGLVWDFKRYPDGRLMHLRSGRFLDADDPRHFGD